MYRNLGPKVCHHLARLGETLADKSKGDGISDNTAAINLAISSGSRCRLKSCQSLTTSPAVVYFPGRTYSISAPIIDFYHTQIIGNPSDLPIIKAASNFTAFALIDGGQYQLGNAANRAGSLGFNSTNVFCRQIKNLVLDTTSAASYVSQRQWYSLADCSSRKSTKHHFPSQ